MFRSDIQSFGDQCGSDTSFSHRSTKIEFMSNISDKQFLKPTCDKSKDCMFKKLKADIKNQNISNSVWFDMYIPGYINKFLQTQGFIQ